MRNPTGTARRPDQSLRCAPRHPERRRARRWSQEPARACARWPRIATEVESTWLESCGGELASSKKLSRSRRAARAGTGSGARRGTPSGIVNHSVHRSPHSKAHFRSFLWVRPDRAQTRHEHQHPGAIFRAPRCAEATSTHTRDVQHGQRQRRVACSSAERSAASTRLARAAPRVPSSAAPRLPCPTLLDVLQRADIAQPRPSSDRGVMVDAMKTTAERRTDGLLSEKRRRHYDHTALLVGCVLELGPRVSRVGRGTAGSDRALARVPERTARCHGSRGSPHRRQELDPVVPV